jgi:aspartate carbamoyltransferase regulatory subunit
MIDTSDDSKYCGKHKARMGNRPKIFRQKALDKYGVKCMNPDCILTAHGIKIEEYMLDVDHIKEVSSFPGDATVQEINHPDNAMVLCKICHAAKTHGYIKEISTLKIIFSND